MYFFPLQNFREKEKWHKIQTCDSYVFSSKYSMVNLQKDCLKLVNFLERIFKSWWKHYWSNMVKYITHKPTKKWERLKWTTVCQRIVWWPKTSGFAACYLAVVYLAFFVLSQKYISYGQESWMRQWNSCGKCEGNIQSLLQPDDESFIPLLKQLTMNIVGLNTRKYSKAIIL